MIIRFNRIKTIKNYIQIDIYKTGIINNRLPKDYIFFFYENINSYFYYKLINILVQK